VPVNPEGVSKLTREQIWKGLELKARDARLFLPEGFCTRCDLVVEGDGFIIRDANILGDDIKEIITFDPLKKVSFFQHTGPREGVIVNELFEDAGGALMLKFYCLLGLRGKANDGPEEQAEQVQMNSEDRGYKAALLSTLVRTRALVSEGKI